MARDVDQVMSGYTPAEFIKPAEIAGQPFAIYAITTRPAQPPFPAKIVFHIMVSGESSLKKLELPDNEWRRQLMERLGGEGTYNEPTDWCGLWQGEGRGGLTAPWILGSWANSPYVRTDAAAPEPDDVFANDPRVHTYSPEGVPLDAQGQPLTGQPVVPQTPTKAPAPKAAAPTNAFIPKAPAGRPSPAGR